MTFFKTRYKVEQDDACEFTIYRREWWMPWWIAVWGDADLKRVLYVADRMSRG